MAIKSYRCYVHNANAHASPYIEGKSTQSTVGGRIFLLKLLSLCRLFLLLFSATSAYIFFKISHGFWRNIVYLGRGFWRFWVVSAHSWEISSCVRKACLAIQILNTTYTVSQSKRPDWNHLKCSKWCCFSALFNMRTNFIRLLVCQP